MSRATGPRRRPWRTIAVVLAVTLGILAAVVVASGVRDLPVGWFLSDPLSTLEADPLTGMVSVLGVMLWSAAAAVCLLAALVVRRSGGSASGPGFFAWAGALSLLLGLDDAFQLHEEVIPAILGHGQTAVLMGYVALTGAYVWWYRRSILAADVSLLLLAGLCFAVSIGIDLVPVLFIVLPGDAVLDEAEPLWEFAQHLVEDGSKFIGIAFWLAFFFRAAAAALAPAAGPSVAPAADGPTRP